MKIEAFELVGHLSMFGNDENFYPQHVVPVGRVDDVLCSVFQSAQGIRVIRYNPSRDNDAFWVSYDRRVLRGLQGFEPERHILFAFSPEDVVAYEKCYENDFFRALLQDPNFGGDRESRPFVRLSLAKRTGDRGLIEPELIASRNALLTKAPNFARIWYAREMEELKD